MPESNYNGKSISKNEDPTKDPKERKSKSRKTKTSEIEVAKEFLDVDAIKSSASFHTKPRQNTALLWLGFSRVLFYPAFPVWWTRRSSLVIYLVHSVLYTAQATLTVLYFFFGLPGCSQKEMKGIMRVEACMPAVVLIVCALGHGRVVSAEGLPRIGNPQGPDHPEDLPTEDENDSDCDWESHGVEYLLSDGEEEAQELSVRKCSSRKISRSCSPDTFSHQSPQFSPQRHSIHSFRKRSWDFLPPPANVLEMDEYEEREEKVQWGVCSQGAVKVALWKGEERQKVSMSLAQLRENIAAQAYRKQQNWSYGVAPLAGSVVAALLPFCFHLLKFTTVVVMTCSAAEEAQEGGAVCEGAVTAGGLIHTIEMNGKLDTLPDGELVDSLGILGGGPKDFYGGDTDTAMGFTSLNMLGKAVLHLMEWVLRQAPSFLTTCDASCLMLSFVSSLAVFCATRAIFRQMALAELTYFRRAVYAKYFASITSSKKARKYNIPHFSLKNVVNIKIWLALRGSRAWLKRHHHQRSSDAVVSSTFFLCLMVLAVMGFEVFAKEGRFLTALVHWELLAWAALISFYLLRFLTLGARINRCYTDTSVVLTEQINVQLRLLRVSQMVARATALDNAEEQSRLKEKRERLQISNNVLTLAARLLKELGSPHKISGLSMDPVLYNIARVVLVSALSALTSEMLGFKLKIWHLFKLK